MPARSWPASKSTFPATRTSHGDETLDPQTAAGLEGCLNHVSRLGSPGFVPFPEIPQSLPAVHGLWRATLLVKKNPLAGSQAEKESSRVEKAVLWSMVTFIGPVGFALLE